MLRFFLASAFTVLSFAAHATAPSANPYSEKLLAVLYSQDHALVAYEAKDGSGLNFMNCEMVSGILAPVCAKELKTNLPIQESDLARFNFMLQRNLSLAAFASQAAHLEKFQTKFKALAWSPALQYRLLKSMAFDGKSLSEAAGTEVLNNLTTEDILSASKPLSEDQIENMMAASPKSLTQDSQINELRQVDSAVDLSTVESAISLTAEELTAQ